MAIAYETYLATLGTPLWEYKMQDVSGPPVNSGSATVNLSSETEAWFTYRQTTARKVVYPSTDTKYYIAQTATSDSGWYHQGNTWFDSGDTTGTFVFLFSADAANDTIFCMSEGTSITAHAIYLRTVSTSTIEFRILGNGGAGTDEITIRTSRSRLNTVAQGPNLVIITQNGSGVEMYLNGRRVRDDAAATVTETSGDAGMWVHTMLARNDGFCLGGQAQWTGAGVYNGTILEELSGAHYYAAYYDFAFTATQARQVWSQLLGGDDLTGGAITVSGRNKFRYYWTTQNRGTSPLTGIDTLGSFMVFEGSSAAEYVFDMERVGQHWFNRTDGLFYVGTNWDSTLDGLIDTTWQGGGMNANANMFFGSDNTSVYLGTDFLSMKYTGYCWEKVTADTPVNSAGSAATAAGTWGRAWAYHPVVDMVMGRVSSVSATRPDAPSVWRYNSGTDNWDGVTTSYTGNTGARSSVSVQNHDCAFSADGNWAAMGANGTGPWNTKTTAALHIWALTQTTVPYDTWTWQTPGVTTASYGVYFGSSSHNDHLFMLQYSASSATINVRCFYNNAGTWTEDNTLFNNNTQLTNWDSVVANQSAMLLVGDDMYIGTNQTGAGRTSWQNLFHLRWNGSYYAEQSDPPWPHATDTVPVGVPIYDIAVTPDGAGVIVTTSNLGADDIPVILGYDRNTSTGALTLRDTPWDFWDYLDTNSGLTVTDSNGDYFGSNPRQIVGLLTTARQAYA